MTKMLYIFIIDAVKQDQRLSNVGVYHGLAEQLSRLQYFNSKGCTMYMFTVQYNRVEAERKYHGLQYEQLNFCKGEVNCEY